MRIILSDNIKSSMEELITLALQNAEDKESNHIIFVPEKFAFNTEKQLILNSKKAVVSNVQVVTFSRLLKRLTQENDSRYLSKEAGIMVTKKIILENIDNLLCFKKTAKTIGFAEQIYDTISELKNSKVLPSDFSDEKKIEKLNASLKIKLQDIFMLYEKYQDYLISNGYIDACDRFLLLSNLVLNNEKIKNSNVYVLGYESITASGLDVLRSLATASKSIVFGITTKSKKNNYFSVPEMLETLEELALGLGIKPTIIDHTNRTKNYIANHISDNLFCYPYSKLKVSSDNLKIYDAKNVNDEINFIAEEIRKLIILKKYRYKDFAIACPDVKFYAETIKKVFDDYKIPAFTDDNISLADHPIIQFILSILNACKKNFDADDMIKISKSFFSNVSSSDACLFENYIIRVGIDHDKFFSPFKFGKTDSFNNLKQDFVIAEKVRKELSSKLLKIKNAFLNSKSVSDFSETIKYIFEVFEIDKSTDRFIQMLTQLKEMVEIERTKQIKDKLYDLLNTMTQIFKLDKLSFDDFYALLNVGIDSATVSLIPIVLDNVFVGDISTSKFITNKILFVVGMNEGVVPYIKDDCGIIVDKELGVLSDNIGKKIEPSIRTINKREKYKFYQLIQCFEDAVYFSYVDFDKQGAEVKPSLAIFDLKKIFLDVETNTTIEILNNKTVNLKKHDFLNIRRKKEIAFSYPTETIAEKKLALEIQKIRKVASHDISATNVINLNSTMSTIYSGFNSNRKQKIEKIFAPKIKFSDTNLKQSNLFFQKNKTSISELETYFVCPFRHYLSYGLNIKEREDASLNSIDFGNILHKVAEKFMAKISEISSLTQEEAGAKATLIINKVFEDEKILSAKNKHTANQLRGEAKRLTNALLYQYQSSRFKPIGEEIVFGEKGKFKALRLNDKISLEGKIDRVDIYENKFRVIDYKTGSIDLQPSNLYFGKKIQLFAYLKALDKQLNRIPVGAFYLPIKNTYSKELEVLDYIASYKMQGFVLNDAETVKSMDKNLSFENPKSEIINAEISTSKVNVAKGEYVLNNRSKKALSQEIINSASEYAYKISQNAVSEILQGNLQQNPIESDGVVACEYCPYVDICGYKNTDNVKTRKLTGKIQFENFV